VSDIRRWIAAVLQAAKGEDIDKLTYEEKEKALNFYALDFEEFLRQNFQPGTVSMEHALNTLSWPAFEPVLADAHVQSDACPVSRKTVLRHSAQKNGGSG
jgi:hypothetical protein